MTLLLIITDYGSFNNFLAELATKFSVDHKNILHVICSKDKIIDVNGKLENDHVNITFHFVNIPREVNLFNQLKAASKIRSIIKTIKPDLIHSHFTTATFPTILFKVRGYKYWASFHGLGMNSSNGFKKLIFSIVEMLCFFRLNKIFLVNKQDFTLVSRLFKYKVVKYKCFGFGCDISKFNAARYLDLNQDQKKELSIADNSRVIAYTGRFVKFKGFNLVIRSFKILTEKYPNSNYKLILMGGIDPIHETGLTKDEELFFHQNENIINIGFTDNVDRYLSVAEIFLFPSKKEGLPTCILESLAMGIPVITFNARGNNDVITDNYNGLLVEPNQDDSVEVIDILKSIDELINNVTKYNDIKENALKNRSLYSRQKFIDESLSYYELSHT